MKDEFIRTKKITGKKIMIINPLNSFPPDAFQFNYLDINDIDKYLADGAKFENSLYDYNYKDAILGMFETIGHGDVEIIWPFASNQIIEILYAVKIGQMLDIKIKEPIDEILGLEKSHFPISDLENSGYGQYRIHLKEDIVKPNWLRIISAYDGEDKRTDSRLPFTFGLRVYGLDYSNDKRPTWKILLTEGLKHHNKKQWHLAVLHVAFSLESFIDLQIQNFLNKNNTPERFKNYINRVTEIKEKIHLLNETNLVERRTKKEIDRYYNRLNVSIFTKRNKIAHGQININEYILTDAVEAIRETVNFIWDFDKLSRKELLVIVPMHGPSGMIDEEFKKACINSNSI